MRMNERIQWICNFPSSEATSKFKFRTSEYFTEISGLKKMVNSYSFFKKIVEREAEQTFYLYSFKVLNNAFLLP